MQSRLRLRLATPCRSVLSRLPRRLLSTGVPCSFGARDGTSITNKHTVLDQVDAALGLARPADIELLLADHLSCVDSTLQRALHGTILRYGHVAVKYTTSDGTQRVMNILGTLDAPGAQRHPCTHTHTHSHARARARARAHAHAHAHAHTHLHTRTRTRSHACTLWQARAWSTLCHQASICTAPPALTRSRSRAVRTTATSWASASSASRRAQPTPCTPTSLRSTRAAW